MRVLNSCENEAELHNNWFILLASDYFDVGLSEIQHERRGPGGIIDIRIMKESRCQIAVELKSPEKTEELSKSFLQAHRYAFSFNYYKNGRIVYPLGILTNGKKAIIFDGSLERPLSELSKHTINLETEDGFHQLISIFENISKRNLGHKLHRPELIDTRPIGVLDDVLQRDFKKFLKKMKGFLSDDLLAFDHWVQLFIIAVLRDCGIIPNDFLKSLQNEKNVSGISKELNRILNENFDPIDDKHADTIWEIYGDTGRFCTRLNLLPADTLGYAYESVLKEVHGDVANSTSVYTPEDLAFELISKLKPTIYDVVIDSAVGTGTLLCVTAEIVWKDEDKKNIQKHLPSYFENNLIAVDRDSYALKCCKAMLLSTFVKILDIEPSELGSSWKLPKLKKVYHSNLFDFSTKDKVTMVIGNPPWGNIDAPNNRVGLTPKLRESIKKQNKAIYCDDSDMSIYIVKHMLDGKMFKVDKSLRAGFLIKQQTLRSSSHEKFRSWAKEMNLKFIDHGKAKRFPHSNASLVAECLFGVSEDSAFIINRISGTDVTNFENTGINLTDFIIPALGFQPSKKELYIKLAKRVDKQNRKKWIKKVYPDAPNMRAFVWEPEKAKEILFVPNRVPFPDDVVTLSQKEKTLLKSRKQLAKNFPYSWRGCEKIDYYGTNLNVPRIFMPKEPAHCERLSLGYDAKGGGIATSGQAVWLKKNTTSEEEFLCILGWSHTKYFMRQLEEAKINLRAHGFCLNPKEVSKLFVPDWALTVEMLSIVEQILANTGASSKDYLQLDTLATRSDLNMLPSDKEN